MFIDQHRFTFYFLIEFLYRHDVAEVAGMTAYSFGEEGVDRYTIVYKKDRPPSDDELATLRAGDEWNEEKAKEIAKKVS